MNLRDDFAHGFGKKKFFTRDVSDRLFHVMICLSLLEIGVNSIFNKKLKN